MHVNTSCLFKTLLSCSRCQSFGSKNSDPRIRVLRIRSPDDVTSLNDFDFDTPSQDSGLANFDQMIFDDHHEEPVLAPLQQVHQDHVWACVLPGRSSPWDLLS